MSGAGIERLFNIGRDISYYRRLRLYPKIIELLIIYKLYKNKENYFTNQDSLDKNLNIINLDNIFINKVKEEVTNSNIKELNIYIGSNLPNKPYIIINNKELDIKDNKDNNIDINLDLLY